MRKGERKAGREVYICIYNMATHSSILAWRILKDRGTWKATVHGVAKSQTRLSDFTHSLIGIKPGHL